MTYVCIVIKGNREKIKFSIPGLRLEVQVTRMCFAMDPYYYILALVIRYKDPG